MLSCLSYKEDLLAENMQKLEVMTTELEKSHQLELQLIREEIKTEYEGIVIFNYLVPCRVGLVVSMSACHMVGYEFASRPGHTKDHHKNGTNCLPAWHAMR